MPLKVELDRIRDKPLTFRTFLDDDYVAEVDSLRVGWILRAGAGTARGWWWTITGPCCGHARVRGHGESAALDDAKEQFRQSFEDWLRWALAEEEPVSWFGTAYDIPKSTFLPKHP